MVGFSDAVDVSLRDVGQALIVDQISSFGIEKNARRNSLMQQFEGAGGTNIRFAGEHDDSVGFLGMVDDEKARRLAGEGNEDREDEEES